MIAFNSMRAVAAANGYMTNSEIEDEIKTARSERRAQLLLLF